MPCVAGVASAFLACLATSGVKYSPLRIRKTQVPSIDLTSSDLFRLFRHIACVLHFLITSTTLDDPPAFPRSISQALLLLDFIY